MIEIYFSNKHQHDIADMMWSTDTAEDVLAIIVKYGIEAQIVYEMIVAAVLDETEDTSLAEEFLDRYRIGKS